VLQHGGANHTLLALLHAAEPGVQACFQAFNPTHSEEYRRVVADWVAALLVSLKHVVDNMEGLKRVHGRGNSSSSSAGRSTGMND
jgi:hypothetical protein